jgi:hypothetical protein
VTLREFAERFHRRLRSPDAPPIYLARALLAREDPRSSWEDPKARVSRQCPVPKLSSTNQNYVLQVEMSVGSAESRPQADDFEGKLITEVREAPLQLAADVEKIADPSLYSLAAACSGLMPRLFKRCGTGWRSVRDIIEDRIVAEGYNGPTSHLQSDVVSGDS